LSYFVPIDLHYKTRHSDNHYLDHHSNLELVGIEIRINWWNYLKIIHEGICISKYVELYQHKFMGHLDKFAHRIDYSYQHGQSNIESCTNW
jgi:hypothetical protein